jgi:hypothetical protein
MSMYQARPVEKRTYPLDVAYLILLISTFVVAGVVIIFGKPDSWFHQNRNEAFSLLLGALLITGVMNLMIGNAYGKLWVKHGLVYRAEHPKLYATYYSMTIIILLFCVVTIVALLFFLPPL